MSKNLEDKLKEIADKLCTPKNEILYNVTLEEVNSYLNESAKQGYELCKKEYEEKLRWIPVEEKLPPLNEQVLLLYDTDEYCVGVMTNYGFYLQPFYPIEQDFGSIYLAGTVNAWRSFL